MFWDKLLICMFSDVTCASTAAGMESALALRSLNAARVSSIRAIDDETALAAVAIAAIDVGKELMSDCCVLFSAAIRSVRSFTATEMDCNEEEDAHK